MTINHVQSWYLPTEKVLVLGKNWNSDIYEGNECKLMFKKNI
jgi:hypothetical protein